MKKTIIAAVFASAFAVGPAFADCAADLKKFDDVMNTTTLDEASKTKATEIVTKAKASLDAQDEAACTASAKEVLTMLGM